MKKIILLFLTIIILFSFASCYKYDGKSLLGTWSEEDRKENFFIVYDFYSDDEVRLTYYNYGIPYATSECHYEVMNGDKINIINDAGYYDTSEFKIKKGKLIITSGSGTELKLAKYESEYNKDTEIFGKWKDTSTEDIYIFNEDYNGIAYTQKDGGIFFSFSTKGEILYFEPSYDSNYILDITYKINEGKFTMSYDGVVYAELERVTE